MVPAGAEAIIEFLPGNNYSVANAASSTADVTVNQPSGSTTVLPGQTVAVFAPNLPATVTVTDDAIDEQVTAFVSVELFVKTLL